MSFICSFSVHNSIALNAWGCRLQDGILRAAWANNRCCAIAMHHGVTLFEATMSCNLAFSPFHTLIPISSFSWVSV